MKNQADLVVDGTLPPHAQIAQLTALLGVRLQIRKAFENAVERDTPAAMGSRMSQHREALPGILEALVARFGRCAILVFGSVQRGAERPDSDLDLIVFYEGDGDLRVERDAKFPDVGVRVDVVLFPDAAFHRLAAKEWYLFWEFSQAEILHDPTGIARRNQDMIRRQLQSRPDIVSAWEELMAQVRRHKLDPSFEVPLTRPAFEDKLRRIYAGEMNGDRKPHPSKQAE